MRIVVLVKQILDPRGITVRRDKERVFINREDYILEPGSLSALEAAMRLKEASGAEVVALCVGEPRAEDALREALAIGCDAAYLATDPAFKDADVSAVVRILAAAVGKLGGADLVIAGRASADTGAGQVGPRLAEALGYAQVTGAYALALEGGALRATRRWGNGFAEVQAPLPAAVTVAPEAFPPRLPHGARIMNAYRQWQVVRWDAGELGLDEAALAPRLRFRGESFPPPVEMGETFRGDPAHVGQELVTALRMQKLIP